MKPLLNPEKDRYISHENGYILHRLSLRDDEAKFYWTRCEIPIAFEEDYRTHKTGIVPVYMEVCKTCIPEKVKDWSQLNWGI